MAHGTAGPFAAIGAIVEIIAAVFALIAVTFVIRGAEERLAAPALAEPLEQMAPFRG